LNKPLPTWRRLAPGALLSMLVLTTAMHAGWAHDGEDHDHDHAKPASAPADNGPRAARQTDDFELVALLKGTTLTFYLDDVDTNEPVKDAKIELESEAFHTTAQQQLPGVYTATVSALLKPGRYPMTISVETAGKADLIDLTWDNTVENDDDGPRTGSGGKQGHRHEAAMRPGDLLGRHPWMWGLCTATLLLAAGLVLQARARSRLMPASDSTLS
jgi:hypothetical protein